jgi:PRTRC genetic system protein B
VLWVADRYSLSVFALGSERRPTANAKLYNAPFFNIYQNGNVCMGTVDVTIEKTASLEEFTTAWEDYFFNSYFSHLMQGHNPIEGNCVLLWENLVNTGNRFPMEVLKRSKRTLNDLIR